MVAVFYFFIGSIYIWTASSEFGTYRLCEQRRFRQACTSAQSRQNLRCPLIQAVSQEDPSDRKPDPWPLWMAGHARLKFVMTECSKTQIHLQGSYIKHKKWYCYNDDHHEKTTRSCLPSWKDNTIMPSLIKRQHNHAFPHEKTTRSCLPSWKDNTIMPSFMKDNTIMPSLMKRAHAQDKSVWLND